MGAQSQRFALKSGDLEVVDSTCLRVIHGHKRDIVSRKNAQSLAISEDVANRVKRQNGTPLLAGNCQLQL